MQITARANTNIALIKYWGKRNEQLLLPWNNSLSITLDQFYTTTSVRFDSSLHEDHFVLNGIVQDEKEAKKVRDYLDKIRIITNFEGYAVVESTNHVPTAAGFASSASGYAALAAAATKAMGIETSEQELSILARLGSGSACRSIYGGFVEWQKGEQEDGSDSYAIPIYDEKHWKLTILSVVVETGRKKVLSREGMKRTVETSPFYAGWLGTVDQDLALLKEALIQRDFEKLGNVTESNALKMHATTLGAQPPFMYWQHATLEVMETVQILRDSGIQAYFTIDAGPNVKVLCETKDEQAVRNALDELLVVQEIFTCHPGSGITYE